MFFCKICRLSNPYMFLLTTIITWPDLFLYLYGNMENREYSYYLSGCLVTTTRLTARDIYKWRPKKRINSRGEIQLLLRERQAYCHIYDHHQYSKTFWSWKNGALNLQITLPFPFSLQYSPCCIRVPLDRLRILVAHRALIIPPSTKDE